MTPEDHTPPTVMITIDRLRNRIMLTQTSGRPAMVCVNDKWVLVPSGIETAITFEEKHGRPGADRPEQDDERRA
jgi:hypothetical protein